MSWLDEAKKIAEQKMKKNNNIKPSALLADENKEALIRKLRLEYDDATEREIEKALNDAEEKFGQNPDEKTLNAFLRTKLES
ncbi:unknown [Acetobacter sp. CAG:977]|nr:unknown [Acetobacter sp. CAG:977]